MNKNPAKFSTPAANPCVFVTREGKGAGLLTLCHTVLWNCAYNVISAVTSEHKTKPAYRRDRLVFIMDMMLKSPPVIGAAKYGI